MVRFQLIEQPADSSDGDQEQQKEPSSLPEQPWDSLPMEAADESTVELDPDPSFENIVEIPALEARAPEALTTDRQLTGDVTQVFDSNATQDLPERPLDAPFDPVDRAHESPVAPMPLTAEAATQDAFIATNNSPQASVVREINGEIEPVLPINSLDAEITPGFEPELTLQPVEPNAIPENLEQTIQDLALNPQELVKPNLAERVNPATPISELEPEGWRPPTSPNTTNVSNQNNVSNQTTVRQSQVPVQPASSVRVADGQPVPSIYQARSEANTDQWLEMAGGSAATQQAVEEALQFLSLAQEADGRWDASRFGGGLERNVLGHDRRGAGAQADTAVTALSLLALLAAGHTHLEGEHSETVRKGLNFLLVSQQTDGNLAGSALFFSQMYCHSMAMLALSEAYAMTGDHRLKNAVQQAVNFSVRAQHFQDGGWRYKAGDSGDMSQFGWRVMALKSARLGGIDVPDTTWQRMKGFLDRCTSGSHRGLASYRPGERATAAMTAEALVCRFFLDSEPSPATLREAARVVNASKPGSGEVNYYYWYYGTLAMKLSGGAAWEEWNQAMTQQLLATQRQDGVLKGSFDANGLWSGYGGRIYSTAMATLCLESYYRYLPALKTDE